MTNKTTIPETVAFRWRVPIVDYDGRQCGESDWKFGTEKGGHPWWTQDSLITTTKAEAYAEARVREALEEAYLIARDVEKSLLSDHLQHVSGAAAANYVANRIRALIPDK